MSGAGTGSILVIIQVVPRMIQWARLRGIRILWGLTAWIAAGIGPAKRRTCVPQIETSQPRTSSTTNWASASSAH